ncbi:hypothetical protein [Bacillus cereus]|uniref:hypothetical protein n=1 Tax=Bacillus cereus TaxID=1396 RepID=UPI000BF5F4F8|nr:hypothetical protein [Bacillus cereus]MEB9844522.1 hypothetical protein [Bacillus cereus]PEZ14680.1 hypothetical protein CN365_29315 [Bacillus cereus]
MKLSVLTEQNGMILALQYVVPATSPLPPTRCISKIVPSEDQLLHEVEVPSKLKQHILQNTLATEIIKYKVEHRDGIARLKEIHEISD